MCGLKPGKMPRDRSKADDGVGEIEKALHLFGESSEDNKAKRLRAFVAMALTARLLFRPYM